MTPKRKRTFSRNLMNSSKKARLDNENNAQTNNYFTDNFKTKCLASFQDSEDNVVKFNISKTFFHKLSYLFNELLIILNNYNKWKLNSVHCYNIKLNKIFTDIWRKCFKPNDNASLVILLTKDTSSAEPPLNLVIMSMNEQNNYYFDFIEYHKIPVSLHSDIYKMLLSCVGTISDEILMNDIFENKPSIANSLKNHCTHDISLSKRYLKSSINKFKSFRYIAHVFVKNIKVEVSDDNVEEGVGQLQPNMENMQSNENQILPNENEGIAVLQSDNEDEAVTLDSVEENKIVKLDSDEENNIDGSYLTLSNCVCYINDLHPLVLPKVFPNYTSKLFESLKEILCRTKIDSIVGSLNVTLKPIDLLSVIEPRKWFNDQIINKYLKLLEISFKSELIYAFDSFFMIQLLNSNKITIEKNVDLTTKRKILIPYHRFGNHWSLIYVDVTKKIISHLDSLYPIDLQALKRLGLYLINYFRDKGCTQNENKWFMNNRNDCPRQTNCHDCGTFVCTAARYISFNNFEYDFNTQQMPLVRQRITYELITTQILY